MRKIFVILNFLMFTCLLLLPRSMHAYTRDLWVGEQATCDATSATNGMVSDVSWSNSGGYISLSGSGLYRTVQIRQYFSGSATVTCTWREKFYANDTPRTRSMSWNFSCKDNPVTISPTNMTLSVGQTANVFASLAYDNAYSSYAEIYFSSSSDKVSVSHDGRIEALRPGTAYVNVYSKASSNHPYCLVTIKEPQLTGISLPSNITLDIEESRSIDATLQPSGATSDINWWSDNNNIAKVDGYGRITGIAEGSTKIWAKTVKGGFTDYCNVTVSEPLLKKVSSSPSNQEKDVSYQVHPSVQFNLPLFEGSAFSQISLKEDKTNVRVQGKVSLDGKTINFVPAEDLQPSTTYVLTVPQNAVNNKWNTGNAEEVLVRFSTVSEPLLNKVSSSPTDQEKDVSPQVFPSVQFNLPLFEGSAFNQISLKEDKTNVRVQGKVSLQGKTLYFVPTEDLLSSTTYVLIVPQNAVNNKWNTGNSEQVLVRFTTGLNLKCFLVWDKQGGCVSFLLEERPRITYDLDNALIHCVTAKQDMDFSLKEVHKYTLDVAPDPQTGIDQVVADSKEKGAFSRQPNTLLLEHFNSGTLVRVYSLNGRLLQTYQVDGEGRLSISTQNWESGVYLIHTGSATYKIIKK